MIQNEEVTDNNTIGEDVELDRFRELIIDGLHDFIFEVYHIMQTSELFKYQEYCEHRGKFSFIEKMHFWTEAQYPPENEILRFFDLEKVVKALSVYLHKIRDDVRKLSS